MMPLSRTSNKPNKRKKEGNKTMAVISYCYTSSFLLAPIFLLLLYFSPFKKFHHPTTNLFSYSLNFYQDHISNSSSSSPYGYTLSTPIRINDILHIKKNKTSLDEIEEDLAIARSAIQEAIRSRNSTSGKKEDFIPRGPVYRNPYAFHQSHTEMEKRFKVWIYKEGEPPVFHEGPMNTIYSIEGQFIDEMESEKNPFMARHPDEAHAFFLPFSVYNVMWFVYKPAPTQYVKNQNGDLVEEYTSALAKKYPYFQRVVEDYINVVANKYPYWNRSSGADHFMVSCDDWAPYAFDAHPDHFKYFIRVVCNANTSEGFQPRRDVSLPEIYLPFGQLGPPNLSQPPSNRPILAFFAGGEHGYIRKVLMQHWRNKDNEVQVHGRLPEGINYTQLMGQSKFCLCPSGFEVASPRVVEAIYAGCVPVIISDSYALPFSDVLDWSKFSVQIPIKKIPDIKNILQGISNKTYLRMQTRVKRVKRHFVVNRPAQRFDVMYMVLHSVWLRRLDIGLLS